MVPPARGAGEGVGWGVACVVGFDVVVGLLEGVGDGLQAERATTAAIALEAIRPDLRSIKAT